MKKPAQPEPYAFLNTEQLAAALHLSVTAIRAIQRWGCPFIAKRSHPEIIIRWLADHPEKVGKIE